MPNDTRRPGGRRRHSPARLATLLAVVLAVTLSAACGSSKVYPAVAVPPGAGAPTQRQLFGVFLGSDETGIRLMPDFEQFLGGTKLRVGHTYLPGDEWSSVEGPPQLLQPWSAWKARNKDSLFVLNVPMATPNEGSRDSGPKLSDSQVSALLQQGAAGEFDSHYTALAKRLISLKLQDTVLIPGWEMNGVTYSHRCGPNPEAWKSFYRHVVAAMRSVPGQQFRFDFNPTRGTDAISWAKCYPGDDVVDIIGMDTYDQQPGDTFADYISEPDGMQAQVDFAKAHGKPVSYPEWGLRDQAGGGHGDNPEFVRQMHDWITAHDTVYSTLTDYCPHGVLTCPDNPQSAQAVQQMFGR